MNKIAVIIVSYKVRFYLEQCIHSVERATEGIDCEILVVDNHSDDGTVEYLKERFADRITLIESMHNLGFSRANNIAIRQSQSEYVLLLNPDTFVGEDSIKTVLRFMDEHPQAGGAGVMMHNTDGTVACESRRGLPTPWVSLMKMMGLSRRYYMSDLSWEEPGRIDVMSGAFCMLRRETLDRVGLLDEDFFMYGEDIDLSYRILKGGYENWYVPARIVHYKGESTVKSSFRYVHVFYQAMLIFFRKHYSHLSLLVSIPIKAAIYARAFLALLQMQYDRMRQSLGFVDKQTTPNYVFIGSDTMLNACRKLARRKGLAAEFVDVGTTPKSDANNCIVYDTSSFSFEQIIDRAKANGQSSIGTYDPDSEILITPLEIITQQ
jgi:GT2 family glycosyltransferase